MSKCEYCKAGWESRSYEGECEDYGCLIMGHGICDEDCKLTKAEINKRLKQLEDYEAGKIERPQWIVNRFIREMDDSMVFSGHLGYSLPGFPPQKMRKGCYESIASSAGLRSAMDAAYERGIKAGKGAAEE